MRTVDATTDPQRVGQPRGHPRVRSFLGVPLRLDQPPIGMIGLANRRGPYEDEHERLTLTYASLIAVLVHNAQLYEQLEETNTQLEQLVADRTRELAAARDALAEKAARLQAVLTETIDTQEQDRQRIAEDIHDGINQLLIGALLEITLPASTGSRPDRWMPRPRRWAPPGTSSPRWSSRSAGWCTICTRRSSKGSACPRRSAMSPSASKAFAHVACRVDVVGRPARLTPRTEISLYRLVQEGLRNVAVHADARRVDVRLHFDPGHVNVELHDDGRGFDPGALERGQGGDGRLHLGLESMRRRVESLAGQWQLNSAPGNGTTIRARVPVP